MPDRSALFFRIFLYIFNNTLPKNYGPHDFKTLLEKCNEEVTLPAGTNGELSFNLGGMQWIVLCNQEGLERSSIHKQRHSGELYI